MKRMLLALPLAITIPAMPNAAVAQTQNSTTCQALATSWDNIEKRLASNLSSGIGDNSAPRSTLRKLEDIQSLAEADMIYQMMKDNKCTLPQSPPSASTYFSAASSCDLERLRKRTADVPECNRGNWKKTVE